MIQDEIRPNIDDLIGEKTKIFYGGNKSGFLYGEAIGVTQGGEVLIKPEYQAFIPNPFVEALVRKMGSDRGLQIQPVEYIHSNNIPFIEGNVIECITNHRRNNKSEDVKKAIQLCVMLLKLDYGFTQEELKEVFNGVK